MYSFDQPFSPGSSDFSIFWRFSAQLYQNYGAVMLQIGDTNVSTQTNCWQFGAQYNSGWRWTAHKWVSGTPTFNVWNETGMPFLITGGGFMYVQRVSGTWKWWSSLDGHGLWGIQSGLGYAPTVNYIGFIVAANGQTDFGLHSIDFVRVNQFAY